jgi:hypothetical protein
VKMKCRSVIQFSSCRSVQTIRIIIFVHNNYVYLLSERTFGILTPTSCIARCHIVALRILESLFSAFLRLLHLEPLIKRLPRSVRHLTSRPLFRQRTIRRRFIRYQRHMTFKHVNNWSCPMALNTIKFDKFGE